MNELRFTSSGNVSPIARGKVMSIQTTCHRVRVPFSLRWTTVIDRAFDAQAADHLTMRSVIRGLQDGALIVQTHSSQMAQQHHPELRPWLLERTCNLRSITTTSLVTEESPCSSSQHYHQALRDAKEDRSSATPCTLSSVIEESFQPSPIDFTATTSSIVTKPL